MLSLRPLASLVPTRVNLYRSLKNPSSLVVCSARGPRPRAPRVWKSRKKIGTISKSQKLVDSIKGLSNVKEEVYGALDSFIAWELEFPLIVIKKALKTMEYQKEWKRIIQVIKWMLSKGQGKTMGTYYSLMNALAEDGRNEEVEELWMKIFNKYTEHLPRIFFTKIMSVYYSQGMHEKIFDVFADMEELGIKPEWKAVKMVGNVFKELGMLDKYEKLNRKYPPPKWEYRYIKGKRVKIPMKHNADGKVVGHPPALTTPLPAKDSDGESNLDSSVNSDADENLESSDANAANENLKSYSIADAATENLESYSNATDAANENLESYSDANAAIENLESYSDATDTANENLEFYSDADAGKKDGADL